MAANQKRIAFTNTTSGSGLKISCQQSSEKGIKRKSNECQRDDSAEIECGTEKKKMKTFKNISTSETEEENETHQRNENEGLQYVEQLMIRQHVDLASENLSSGSSEENIENPEFDTINQRIFKDETLYIPVEINIESQAEIDKIIKKTEDATIKEFLAEVKLRLKEIQKKIPAENSLGFPKKQPIEEQLSNKNEDLLYVEQIIMIRQHADLASENSSSGSSKENTEPHAKRRKITI